MAEKTNSRKRFVFFSILSIAVTVVLAGLRDYSIGIDTVNYMTLPRFWKGAVERDSLFSYMKYYNSLGFGEPLFALLIGGIAQLTGEYRVFLFAAHTLIITGVYIGMFRQREHISPSFTLLLFYLIYFNHSLNIMRQYIAMSIIFAAAADITKNKHFRYIIVVLICSFVHKSAFLGFLPLIFYFFLYGNLQRFNLSPSDRRNTLILLLTCSAILFLPLCKILMDTGILPSKYSFFLNVEMAEPPILASLFILVEFIFILILRKQLNHQDPQFKYFMMCSYAFFALYQLSWFMVYGKRVAAYLCMTNLITIGMIEQSFQVRENQRIARAITLIIALVYWLYVYALRNGSQTYPYLFGI